MPFGVGVDVSVGVGVGVGVGVDGEETLWTNQYICFKLGSPQDESRVLENPELRAPIGWHLIELAVSTGH
ncbi:hypothetical protein M0802_013447 [Mischocyttarus mexicanus]|nr:hypothetical protein M0802_013459 [Mischocyttarus mexicanus]KAI4483383.1 hypothetical protein M0802_013447 [Mischocyttarus mexicanus]